MSKAMKCLTWISCRKNNELGPSSGFERPEAELADPSTPLEGPRNFKFYYQCPQQSTKTK